MATPLKIPPPPPIAAADPTFNRWLVELQGILSTSGGIDPNQIPGYTALQSQVATNTTNVATLEGEVSGHSSDIASLESGVIGLNSEVSTINGQITTIDGQITALQARNVVLSGTAAPAAGTGSNGDWFGDTTNKHIYIKVAGAWVQIV